jgi:hypothetical protein
MPKAQVFGTQAKSGYLLSKIIAGRPLMLFGMNDPFGEEKVTLIPPTPTSPNLSVFSQ